MPVSNSKSTPSDSNGKSSSSGNQGHIRSDPSHGSWRNADGFAIGSGNEPPVLAINGFADTNVDIELQTAVPADFASIQISLGNVVNLDAMGFAGASGTVSSSAASQGLLTLTNGNLSGTYTAMLSIDVTASIAADHATVNMHLTDSFQLTLSGTGYLGASLALASTSGGTVTAITPSGGSAGNSAGRSDGGTFDLARFVANVLNTGTWDIDFVASMPGESLHALGASVLTIDATAEVPNGESLKKMQFSDTDRSNLTFNDTSSPTTGSPFGVQSYSSGPGSLFHTV